MWRDGETPDLRSERRSSMREYRNMASPSKAAYSERKRQKSTFILTVNSPVYPPIQGKENRLFLRPFIAAKETGGLDFLIAHALLIVCHSLFEVVIEVFHNALTKAQQLQVPLRIQFLTHSLSIRCPQNH